MLRRHAAGFTPRDLTAAGVRPVVGAADLRAAQARGRTRRRQRRRPRLHRRPRARHPAEPVRQARGRAPAVDRPARVGEGLGLAERLPSITPDHVQTMVLPGAGATACSCGPRPSSRASSVDAILRSIMQQVQVPDLAWPSPEGSSRSSRSASCRSWCSACSRATPLGAHRVARCSAVAARRGRPRARRLAAGRRPATAAAVPGPARRLGDEHALRSPTTAGAASAALVRDAWQPSAGAPTERLRVDLPPGERRSVSLGAHAVPPGRAARVPGHGAVVRSARPRRPAGDAERAGRLRVLPPFTSRKHLPTRLARLRELDGAHERHGPRSGHRVRLASASTCGATTSVRSTGVPRHAAATS